MPRMRMGQAIAAAKSPTSRAGEVLTKVWDSDAEWLANGRQDKFYCHGGKVGIGYFEDFDVADYTTLKWRNNDQIWTMLSDAGGEIVTKGYPVPPKTVQGVNPGASVNYSVGGISSEPLTAKPERPIFFANGYTWIVTYNGSSGWTVYRYDLDTDTMVDSMDSVITSSAPERVDACWSGSALWLAFANVTQNKLYKLSYIPATKKWQVDNSADVSGAMNPTQNPNPHGGADCYNAPHLCVQADTAGKVWLFWHTQDTLDLDDVGTVRYMVLAASNLAVLQASTVLFNNYGDDVISTVTFNDGTASIGVAMTKHSLVKNHPTDTFEGVWFLHHHDSDDITTWQTVETIEPADSMDCDDHLSLVADASGNLYVAWKTNNDGVSYTIQFKKRTAGSTFTAATKTYPFMTTTAETRPCLGIHGSYIVCGATLGGNVIARSADLATLTWSATINIVDAAATVNNCQFSKNLTPDTTKMVCVTTGASDTYHYLGVIPYEMHSAPSVGYLQVRSNTSGTDGLLVTAKMNLPSGVSKLTDKYTVTYGNCLAYCAQTPFTTEITGSGSGSTMRTRVAAGFQSQSSPGTCVANWTCVSLPIASPGIRHRKSDGTADTSQSGVYPTCGGVSCAGLFSQTAPFTVKMVVEGTTWDSTVSTCNGNTLLATSDTQAYGSANTLAIGANWMLSGGYQHRMGVDYVWLEGGFASGTFVTDWFGVDDITNWTDLDVVCAIAGDQSIDLDLEYSNTGGEDVADWDSFALVNGTNNLTPTKDYKYARLVLWLDVGTTNNTPTVDSAVLQGTVL